MLNSLVKTMSSRDWLIAFALSAILSVCGVFGVSYVAGEGSPVLDLSSSVALIFLFTFIFVALFILGDLLFDLIAHLGQGRTIDGAPDRFARLLDRVTPRWSRKSILLFAVIMGLFWLPWFIANFPGSTYWDTYYQMYQVYPENHPIAIIPWSDVYWKTLTDAWLVDHHPVLTTMIYGAFGWVSDQLTGNWMAGVFAFVCIQGIAYLLVFTGACAYMRRIGCPLIAVFATYVFFTIMPFISTWSLCMVKDSLFAIFFIGYFMGLFETVRTRGTFLGRPRNLVLFCLCALMLCLTKKTGLFVVIPAAVFLAIKLRGKGRAKVWESLAPALVSVAIAGIILPLAVFPALNIIPGGKQEVLGPLFQQTARYVADHGDEVTDEEREAIAKVLDYDRLAEDYQFDFEDAVKYRYNLDATNEDIANYLQVYAQQGWKHPDSYAAAFWGLAGYYVAPTAFINIRMVTVDTKMGEGDAKRYMLWNPDELDWLRNGLDDAYGTIARIPGLDVPLLIVTYALWIPALLFYCMCRRRVKAAVLFVPFLVLLAFCIIAPVYDARYVIPIFDAVPLLACAMYCLSCRKSIV